MSYMDFEVNPTKQKITEEDKTIHTQSKYQDYAYHLLYQKSCMSTPHVVLNDTILYRFSCYIHKKNSRVANGTNLHIMEPPNVRQVSGQDLDSVYQTKFQQIHHPPRTSDVVVAVIDSWFLVIYCILWKVPVWERGTLIYMFVYVNAFIYCLFLYLFTCTYM